MNTYFWGLSSEQIATLTLFLLVALVFGAGLARPVSARFEKRRTAVVLAGGAILWGPLPIFMRLLGVFPPNGHPAVLPLLVVHTVVLVTAAIMTGIVLSSMIADVIDEGELETGRRQEGMFSSAIAFAAKAVSGLGGFLAGVALDAVAFPRQAEPGQVPEDLREGIDHAAFFEGRTENEERRDGQRGGAALGPCAAA